MIRIRLKRIGKKRHPYYRVVVADKLSKRDGGFIAELGSYDPHANPPAAVIDADKAREWIAKGAQPSEAAEKILKRLGIIGVAGVVAAATATTAAAPVAAAAAD